MALKTNGKGLTHARALIAAGKINKGAWSFSAADGNKLLGPNGDNWAEYARWFLAVDSDAEPDTKQHYKYPFGKSGQIYRSGVIAAKSRAAQQGETTIADAADALLQAIDAKAKDAVDDVDETDEADDEYYVVEDRTEADAKKAAARHAVEEALKRGDLKRPAKCTECGKTADTQAHHHKGYDEKHWLDVVWVCNACNNLMKGKKKKKDGECVNRFDRIEAPNWMTKPFERTPEGFLRGRAVVTNIGVFEYRDALSGKVSRELRLPEEVFALPSLESLKLKPVTNDHPSKAVTPDNVRELQVGSLGDNPSSSTQQYGGNGWRPEDEITDGLHLAIDMVITEAGAIDDVINGKDALSCGYTCDLEKADDNARFLGMPYDFIQRTIRYNHVALVDNARAGTVARIRMDSAEAVLSFGAKEDYHMPEMKKLVLDGVEYQAEAQVATALNQAVTKADAAEKQVKDLITAKSTVEGERDGLKAKVTALEGEVTKAKADAADPKKIEDAVNARIKLRETAKLAEVEVKDGMSEKDLKCAVILKASPAADLKDKDDAYISARFDAAIEILDIQKKADAQTRAAAGGGDLPSKGGSDHKDGEPDAEKAREDYIKHISNAGRAPLGQKA